MKRELWNGLQQYHRVARDNFDLLVRRAAATKRIEAVIMPQVKRAKRAFREALPKGASLEWLSGNGYTISGLKDDYRKPPLLYLHAKVCWRRLHCETVIRANLDDLDTVTATGRRLADALLAWDNGQNDVT